MKMFNSERKFSAKDAEMNPKSDASDTQYSGHWVEELFPPKYAFSLEDFHKEVQNTKKQSPKKVTPLDVSRIKNVYERVYMMTVLEEEERKKMDEEQQEKKNASGRIAVISSDKAECLEDSGVWNAKEIEVLRDVFKTTKTENSKLRYIVEDLQKKLDKCEEKCKQLEKLIKVRTKTLGDALKANKRLQIQCDNSDSELGGARKRIQNLSDNLNELKKERVHSTMGQQDLSMKYEKEKMERKKTKGKLDRIKFEFVQEQTLREEKLKNIYEKEIEFVLERLEEMTQNYDKERDQHARTQKALDHLRKHFSFAPETAIAVQVLNQQDEVAMINYIAD